MKSKIARKIARTIVLLVKYLPFNGAMRLRNAAYTALLKKAGKGFNICDAVTIVSPEKLALGDRVSIHEYSYFGGGGEITIGNYVAIANNCSLIPSSHNFESRDRYIKEQGGVDQPIVIEDDVWLGSKVTVLGNVTIGRGAIIGAGSVVTKDVPAYAVAVGVPCRVLRYRPE